MERMNMKIADPDGFSLIELMVALAIVAILSAVALPAYGNYLTRARRAEGRVALMQMMQQQEIYFSQNNSYSPFGFGAGDGAASQFRWWSGADAASSYYELSASACDGDSIKNCITLRATPGTEHVRQGFSDGVCGVLSLSSSGARAPQLPSECWQ